MPPPQQQELNQMPSLLAEPEAVADFPEWGQPPKPRGRTRLALAMKASAHKDSHTRRRRGSVGAISTTTITTTKMMQELRDTYGLNSSHCKQSESIHCVNNRVPFGAWHPSLRPDIGAPGPGHYKTEKSRKYLHSTPGVKISNGPRMEKATKRFWSREHCEQSQKLLHSPGPIYAVATDFYQKPLPKRQKRIKKRQVSHQQRAMGMKGRRMPGCHVRAWQAEPKVSTLYPYTNADPKDNRSLQDCYPDNHSYMSMTDSMSRKTWAIAHSQPPINAEYAPDRTTVRPSQVWGTIEERPRWDVCTLPTKELSLTQSRAPFFSKNSQSENLL